MFSGTVDGNVGADAGGVGRLIAGFAGRMDGGDRRAGDVEPLRGDGPFDSRRGGGLDASFGDDFEVWAEPDVCAV